MGAGCSSDLSGSLVHLNKDNIPHYKVVLIGDPGVGKTNVLLRYALHQFDYGYMPTTKVNIKNVVSKLNVPANAVVSLTLWDIPGHEDMDLRKTYYRNVDAALVVVDLSDPDSIELAGTWRQDFLSKASRTVEQIEMQPNGVQTVLQEPMKGFDPRSVPMILLGNKFDLVEEQQQQQKMKSLLDGTEAPSGGDQLAVEGGEDLEALARELDCNMMEDPPNKKNAKDSNEESDSGDSDDEEQNNKEVPEEAEEDEDEKKPECIKLLEQMEAEYGFTTSIAVSAKNKDGSVEMTLQSLVRHLLLKQDLRQFKAVKVKAAKKVKKKKHVKVAKEELLSPVGDEELDRVFSRCSIPLQRALDYESYYEVSLKRFKQACVDQGYIHKGNASLEECMVGLRDYITDKLNRPLQVEGDGGFLKLYFDVYKGKEEKKLMKQHRFLKMFMDSLENEYCALCKAILRDGPVMDAILVKLDNQVRARVELLRQEVRGEMPVGQDPPRDEKTIERILVKCERNQARVAHSRLVIKELLETVGNAMKKIKASLLW